MVYALEIWTVLSENAQHLLPGTVLPLGGRERKRSRGDVVRQRRHGRGEGGGEQPRELLQVAGREAVVGAAEAQGPQRPAQPPRAEPEPVESPPRPPQRRQCAERVEQQAPWMQRRERDPLSPLARACPHACTHATPSLHPCSQDEQRSSPLAFPAGLARKADLHEQSQAPMAMQATKHGWPAPTHAGQAWCKQPNTPTLDTSTQH
uniref:Uncharacterized protein n=1 Tax=Oryza glumipatula TaxID=40148 RepID=A0A0D9YC02_9ORYZ